MHRSVSKGTKDLLLFKMPMQEAIFFEICAICTFQVKFSYIYIFIYSKRFRKFYLFYRITVNSKRQESIKSI